MAEYFVAWWNVENLFDVEHSPNRPESIENKVGKDLAGWTQEILNKKIGQLVKIIRRLNGPAGPDLLGVCEVENRQVLEQLVNALNILNRNYGIVHVDSPDKRGIDVAFVYDKNKLAAHEQFNHFVMRRTATRDLFQVNFRTIPADKELRVIGNHWPSRSGGTLESEPYRQIAGETLSYWMQRIVEIAGQNAPVLIMGDFNDNPFDSSLLDYAQASNSSDKVKNAKSVPRLFNLMWPFCAQGIGSHYYDSSPDVLDQFLISRGVLTGEGGFSVKSNPEGKPQVKIEMVPEMMSGGVPDPIRFNLGGEADVNLNGYSDHYPISLVLLES
ncbi:MAG: endonuclease/exonuclease/phosphatase family protein [bacterium]